MKIDLHCHTKAVRRGELPSRNVTKDVFASKVIAANNKIVAITNHDLFDKGQFEEFQQEVGDACILWPGIEFNIEHNDEKYHMIVIASPNNLDDFEAAIGTLIQGKVGDFDVGIDDVINAFSNLSTLFLPHFGSKTPGISQSNLADLYKKIPNKNRIILEDSNSRSTAILSIHGMRTITGSDVKDWGVYQDSDVSELRIPVGTFEHFCLFLDRDPTVIKTLLDKNHPKIYRGRPSKENESISVDFPLFSEVNIIFGDKGTGKSQIIDSVRKKMEADGLSVSSYISSKKDEDIKELVDSSGMDRSAEQVGASECENEFQAIRWWGDKNIESLQTFIRHGETKHVAANKDRIKVIDQQALPYDENLLLGVEQDLAYVTDAIDSIENIEGDYLSEKRLGELFELLAELKATIRGLETKELIEKNSCRLVGHATRRIRAIVASKTGTVAKPSSTSFYEYAKNRIALYDATCMILQNFAPTLHKDQVVLGNIGDKGDIFVESRWKMLDSDSRQREYSGSPLISKLRDSVANIKDIQREAFSDDPQDYLDAFADLFDNFGITRVGVFVGTSRYIVDNDMNEYNPSNGEKAIVMIQRALSEDKDAYLLDEPELSLGGTYIDKVIRPELSKLGKANKIVFIATHNANIAVRTLPYNTIYRLHDKSGYKTYLGNPFINKLVNINDQNDCLDWKEVSMRVLEGGADAFNDRGEIYETGSRSV